VDPRLRGAATVFVIPAPARAGGPPPARGRRPADRRRQAALGWTPPARGSHDGCQFAASWGHLSPDFCSLSANPCDALIASSVEETHRGKAFGLKGIGDNLGACLGPLLAIAGWAGLVVAGSYFIVPAALITLGFAWAYTRFGALPEAGLLLHGVKPVIIAIAESVENGPFTQMKEAIDTKDKARAVKVYKDTLAACSGCYEAASKPFLRPRIPAEPQVQIVNFTPGAPLPEELVPEELRPVDDLRRRGLLDQPGRGIPDLYRAQAYVAYQATFGPADPPR
jgi:hypothetical protein